MNILNEEIADDLDVIKLFNLQNTSVDDINKIIEEKFIKLKEEIDKKFESVILKEIDNDDQDISDDNDQIDINDQTDDNLDDGSDSEFINGPADKVCEYLFK